MMTKRSNLPGKDLPHSLEVVIEELILYGFNPGDRYSIGEAMERELTRLLAERGVEASLVRGGEIARLDGGTFQVPQGSNPETIGTRAARAVYLGIRRQD